MNRKYYTLFLLIILSSTVLAQTPPAPEQILGFQIGEDYKLADLHQIYHYFNLLAQNSDRISIAELGFTTEGNRFLLAIISSADNLAKLDQYKEIQKQLADPRLINDDNEIDLIKNGKTVVSINCSIHSTEIGASQMAMQLAYDLLTSDTPEILEILDNVIILLIPVQNPDGLNIVVNWYEKYLGTKYEGCRLPVLYHKYTGHDINRDWYMLTQKETRLTVERVYNEWHPQIVLDMHQMGTKAPRLFLPPYTDPYDPYIDPILISEIAMLGFTIISDLTAQDFKGIITNEIFDAWAPSRAYMHYHAGIRILSELASCHIASPIKIVNLQADTAKISNISSWNYFNPWCRGEWSIGDIIRYDKAVAMSLLTHAAKYRKQWLRNFYEIGKKAVDNITSPNAFILPQNQSDKALLYELLQILHRGQVEIHQSLADFYVNGQKFTAGSYIIFMNQPYAAYAKTLLSVQHYPKNVAKKSYDISGHTLPFLFGVKAIPAHFKFDVPVSLCKEISITPGRLCDNINDCKYFVFSHKSNYSYKAMNFLMQHDYHLYCLQREIRSKKGSLKPGTVILENNLNLDELQKITNEYGLDLDAFDSKVTTVPVYKLTRPRVGLYKSWVRSMDEGWTRYVLEEYGFEYESLYDSTIQAGDLNSKFDVIIFPNLTAEEIKNGHQPDKMPPEFCGGVGNTGVQQIKKFVKKGGTLIPINLAANLFVDQFKLPVTIINSTNIPQFWAPGPIVKITIDRNNPIGFGFSDEAAIVFANNHIIKNAKGQKVAWYSEENLLLSGALEGEKILSSKPLILEIPYGSGKIIIFGFRPFFRAQTRGVYRLLFNAIMLSNATATNLEITDSF